MITADDFTHAHDALLVAVSGSPEPDEQAYLSAGMTRAQIDALRARIVKLWDAATDPEACAKVMVDYATANADRSAWTFIFARFDDFVRSGKTPPAAFIEAINERLCVFRSEDSTSLDDAFFGKRNRGHPKSTINAYWWEKTNASLVQYFRSLSEQTAAKKLRGDLSHLEKGIAATISFRKRGARKNVRGLSISEIKRHYLKFKSNK